MSSTARVEAVDEERSPTTRHLGFVGHLRLGILLLAAALLTRIPDQAADALARLAGAAWYRWGPAERRRRARRNLARVAAWLAARGEGPPAVRQAASDRAALEALVRRAYTHAARYYLDLARSARFTPRYLRRHLEIETPEVAAEALGRGASIFLGLHLGAVEIPAFYAALVVGRRPAGPMETVDDPALQRFFELTRGRAGIRIFSLAEARHGLARVLASGEPVGIVADRDVTGSGGYPTELFGHPAPLPVGPALLALETGVPVYVVSARWEGPGRYVAAAEALPAPGEGTRRQRLEALLAAEARAFERAIARAPDQWWTVFFPIWPDLEDGGPSAAEAPGGGERG
jgi:lauroyl/myristoyl acyltransferase